jgi:hypothetical protein
MLYMHIHCFLGRIYDPNSIMMFITTTIFCELSTGFMLLTVILYKLGVFLTRIFIMPPKTNFSMENVCVCVCVCGRTYYNTNSVFKTKKKSYFFIFHIIEVITLVSKLSYIQIITTYYKDF